MPDAADTATIMAQIDKCPSGALGYTKNIVSDEPVVTTDQPAAIVTNIECLRNGPLIVQGEIVVKKSDGTEETRMGPIAFCRCGTSKNKPYCDGGHQAAGFEG